MLRGIGQRCSSGGGGGGGVLLLMVLVVGVRWVVGAVTEQVLFQGLRRKSTKKHQKLQHFWQKSSCENVHCVPLGIRNSISRSPL